MTAQLLVDAKARLGECVLWCELSNSLYWTDIEGFSLSCWHAADGRVQQWTLPQRVGSFALCHGTSRLLVGLASGIALFDTTSEALSPVVPVEPEHPTTRINDGRCDPQGRFVFGMFNQAADGAPIGHFYRVHADLTVERLPLPPASVGNSIAFSPDGTTLYYTDSPTRTIYCASYFADGRIGLPRPFARLSASEGTPTAQPLMPTAACGMRNGRAVASYGMTLRAMNPHVFPSQRRSPPASPSAEHHSISSM